MKNKLLILIVFLLTILVCGCETNKINMYIDCKDEVVINQYLDLQVYYNNQEVQKENLQWTLSNYEVANIVDGKLYAKDYGEVIVGVVDVNDSTHYCTKKIKVVAPYVEDIIIDGKNEMYISKTIILKAKVVPSIIESEIIWASSNEDILVVDDGEVYALNVGVADIIVTCDNFEKRFSITVLPTPDTIDIYGENNISVNEVVELSFNIDEKVILQSSDSNIVDVVDNTIVGISKGSAIITAIKESDNAVKGTIEIIVNDDNNAVIEMTEEEENQIATLLDSMSIDQMVGEMFNIGLYVVYNSWGESVQIEASTGLPYAQFDRHTSSTSVLEYLSDYKFGNFTIYSAVGSSRDNLMLATNTLKELAVSNTGIEPFIMLNSCGGYLMSAITALPTNQALANASVSSIAEINDLYSQELKALGINVVLNSYLNYNSEYNDSINTYGSDITKALVTAATVNSAYQKNNVIAMANASVYGQYVDERSLDELQKTDLKLLTAAIQNNAQMISIPATVYTNVKENYYAFLNEDFIKGYIREQLGYDGIIYLGDEAIYNTVYDEDFYDYIVNAINLGVDMIGFDLNFSTSPRGSYREMAERMLKIYQYIISSVESGAVSEERIKQAVTRILLAKIRNNILNNESDTEEEFNFSKNASLIGEYAHEFITINGNKIELNSNQKILVISEIYSKTNTTNSFGDNFRNFFGARGYSNLSIHHCNTMTPQSIINSASGYDVVFIEVSTLTSSTSVGIGSDSVKYVDFINQILNVNDNVCVIATKSPNVMNYLPNVKNSVLLYNYYEDNFESLFKVLNNEFE